MWLFDDLLNSIADAIHQADLRLREEQAVHGLDALDELGLHPLIAAAFDSANLGVLREQPYPTTWKKRSWRAGDGEDLPLPRDRERCDLTLTPHSSPLGVTIADEVRATHRRRAVRAEAQGSLFESIAQSHIESGAFDLNPANTSGPLSFPAADAMWIEVKTLGQFEFADGVPGPNPSYASRLIRSVTTDIAKLASDTAIQHAASLVILFTADEPTAEHDLLLVAHKCLDRDLPIASPVRRAIPIADRIGNTTCNLALFPIKR